MRRVVPLFVLFLILCIGCNRKKSDRVEREQNKPYPVSFELLANVPIGTGVEPKVSAVMNQKELCAYFFDQIWPNSKKMICHRFDLNLTLKRSSALKVGQGPGDVINGATLFGSADKIVISDCGQKRINIFDQELHYIAMLRANSLTCKVVFSEDGTCFLQNSGYWYGGKADFKIELWNFPGLKKTEIFRFGPFDEDPFDGKKRIRMDAIPDFQYFLHGSWIYFLDCRSFRLIQFSRAGKRIKSIRYQVDPVVLTEDQKEKSVRERYARGNLRNRLDRMTFSDVMPPAAWAIKLAKGFVVVRRKDWSMECQGSLAADYFDWDLNPKGKVSFPCFFGWNEKHYEPLLPFINGNLYTISEKEDSYYLQKWLVTE